MTEQQGHMDRFFHPSSVAVFGVSSSPRNMGRVIIENLERFGFGGMVYAVGSREGTVAGKPIYRTVEEIPDVPDLAVFLIPAHDIPHILDACGKKGVKAVIIESGGFSELDRSKKGLEKAIRAAAETYGMTIVGPNCFGIVNGTNGLILPFFIFDPSYMKRGTVSLVSQSGGVIYDTCMLFSCENLGIGKFVSVGNKLLVDENDVVDYLVNDPETSVIALYLEHFSGGRRFMDIVSATDKPVVLLKGNRTGTGREIARFHTAALAGDDDVTEAAMKQIGVHRVQNMSDMIDYCKIFSLPLLKGRRLAVISRSGGHGVLAADGITRYGFELAPLSQNFFAEMKSKKRGVINATNPLDIGDVYDLNEYSRIAELALAEQAVDGVVFVATYSSETDGDKITRFLKNVENLVATYGKPVALSVATNRKEWFHLKTASNVPVFHDVDHVLHVLRRSYDHYLFRTSPRRQSGWASGGGYPEEGMAEGGRLLHPAESFRLLEKYGMPVAPFARTGNGEESVRAARELGYPVALKMAVPEVVHKTENRGVRLNIPGDDELEQAVAEMGGGDYLVQAMCPPGYEVILGARFDREFGHVILFGLGGTFVEAMKDTAIRVVPVRTEASAMIREIRGSAILDGFRGAPPADRGALEDVIRSLSRLLEENPSIMNVDINPVIVFEEGNGCVIVDVKIEKNDGNATFS